MVSKYDHVVFAWADAEEYSEVVEKHNIEAVPSIVIFHVSPPNLANSESSRSIPKPQSGGSLDPGQEARYLLLKMVRRRKGESFQRNRSNYLR